MRFTLLAFLVIVFAHSTLSLYSLLISCLSPLFASSSSHLNRSHHHYIAMPGDLNLKKSWNPALMKNQKKVWEREQEALKEYQTIKQRSKEIALEREKEEMIRLQYGNDPTKLPTKHKLELNKLGWMYDGPKEEVDEAGFREVEENFLEKNEEVEQLIKGRAPVRQAATSRFDSIAYLGVARPAALGLLSDDPLLAIKREQRIKRPEPRDRERDRLPSRRHKSERSDRKDRSDRSERSRSERNGSDRNGSDRSKHSSRSERHRHDRHRSDKSSGRSSDRSSGRSERPGKSSDRHERREKEVKEKEPIAY